MKVCFITGSRADYGLLRPLMHALKNDSHFKVQIIATGMHLSPEFGFTYKEIENDGFHIDEYLEILLSSDTHIGVSKAMGLAMISFTEAYQRLSPELIIGLGDRFELFSAVSSALVSRIPVAHIHGGEITSGAFDDGFRHAITKMSHLHFTSTEVYRNRVLQLGEDPEMVFNVGALGLDNIRKMPLLSKSDLEQSLGTSLDKPYFVVTYHPVTLESRTAEIQIRELISVLDELKSYKIIFTKSNADNEGRIINSVIDEFVSRNTDRAFSFFSLGQIRYLSALKYTEMVIGNSSSGIIEVPFFEKPTINIGDRQTGRILSQSVIQCGPERNSIRLAVNKACSEEFISICRNQPSIYGDGRAAEKILNILKNVDLTSIIRKNFFDFPPDRSNSAE